MRALRAARRFLSPTTIVALAAILTPEGALATCYYNVPGNNVFALTGDSCSALPFGAYNPPPTTLSPPLPPSPPAPAFPVSYTGFGFFADNGGVINADGVTINTDLTATAGYGAWSDGTGAQINLTSSTGSPTINTYGSGAYGLYATNGGAISADLPFITTNNDGASGVYASGVGSQINLTSSPTVQTFGVNAYGLYTSGGAVISAAAGPIIYTASDGAFGLFATGAGSQITTTGVADIETGLIATDTPSGQGAGADAVFAENGGSITVGQLPFGGSILETWHDDAIGARATTGGTVTLNADLVTTLGARSPGVQADAGGLVTVNGGSVTTSGANSPGLYATGSNGGGQSSITTNSGLRRRRGDRDDGRQQPRRPVQRGRPDQLGGRIGDDVGNRLSGPLCDRRRRNHRRQIDGHRDRGRRHDWRGPGPRHERCRSAGLRRRNRDLQRRIGGDKWE